MKEANLEIMNLNNLRHYVLTHREDFDAFISTLIAQKHQEE